MSGKTFADEMRESLSFNKNVSFNFELLFSASLDYGYQVLLDENIERMKKTLTSKMKQVSNPNSVKEISGYHAIGAGIDGSLDTYKLDSQMIHDLVKKSARVELPSQLFYENSLFIENNGVKLLNYWPEAQDVWNNLLSKGEATGTTTSMAHTVLIPLSSGKLRIARWENSFNLAYVLGRNDCIEIIDETVQIKTGLFKKEDKYVCNSRVTDFGKRVIEDITRLSERDGIEVEPKLMTRQHGSYNTEDYVKMDSRFEFDKPLPYEQPYYNKDVFLGFYYKVVI